MNTEKRGAKKGDFRGENTKFPLTLTMKDLGWGGRSGKGGTSGLERREVAEERQQKGKGRKKEAEQGLG